MKKQVTHCYGFKPVASKSAQILILGSMPGAESLKMQQYYAHPRNAFWPIMQALFGTTLDWSYEKRCQHLISQHIAVWDVLKACDRRGSLDSNIDTETIKANDFNRFFKDHPNIKKLYFNGAKAEQTYQAYVLATLDEKWRKIPATRLASTSPAYAVMSQEQKIKTWKKALSNQ